MATLALSTIPLLAIPAVADTSGTKAGIEHAERMAAGSDPASKAQIERREREKLTTGGGSEQPTPSSPSRSGDTELELVDVRSATFRPGPSDPSADTFGDPGVYCAGLGWSPDSRALIVPRSEASFVADLRGRILQRLPDRHAVNNSMSWSPDGRLILLYDPQAVRFVVRDLGDGSETVLRPGRGGPAAMDTPRG
ncbi:MAG: TolB family protein, partial [Actinomycetes bacterium]